MNLDRDELLAMLPPEVRREVKRQLGEGAPKKKGRHKYGAKAVTVDGVRYPSRREARYHETLKHLHAAGQIRWWMEQPRLLIEGGFYYPDFLVLTAPLCPSCAEALRVVDTKGVQTKTYRQKKRQVKERYGIEILEA